MSGPYGRSASGNTNAFANGVSQRVECYVSSFTDEEGTIAPEGPWEFSASEKGSYRADYDEYTNVADATGPRPDVNGLYLVEVLLDLEYGDTPPESLYLQYLGDRIDLPLAATQSIRTPPRTLEFTNGDWFGLVPIVAYSGGDAPTVTGLTVIFTLMRPYSPRRPARRTPPADDGEEPGPGGPIVVIPSGPAFDLNARTYSIPNDEGVDYFVNAIGPIIPGLQDVFEPGILTVTAYPQDGYTFPTDPSPITEWSMDYPAPESWTLIVDDALASGTLDTSRDAAAPGFGPYLWGPQVAGEITGGWLTLTDSSATIYLGVNADSIIHAAEAEYDLTGVVETINCGVMLSVNYAWGRHNFKIARDDANWAVAKITAAGTAATPTITPADGQSITGHPLTGLFRVETDGTTISVYIDEELVGTALRQPDNNPGWAGDPNFFEVRVISEPTSPNPSTVRMRNVKGYKQPQVIL